jgi:transcriptional regulator with XRE-family HTH domain
MDAKARWAHWLEERMIRLGWTTNSQLARASGVPDSVISRWRSGASQPALEQLRRLRDPLQASMLELMVAAGHVSEKEAGLADVPAPDPQFRDLRDAIRRDGQLSQDLKDLLLVQYDAMLALSRAREQQTRSAS